MNNNQDNEELVENRLNKVGNASKTAGTVTSTAGKTARLAGTAGKYGGKAVNYAGKGISKAGNGMLNAGKSLSSTGYGAIAGVPLAALGAATTAAGKTAEIAGKATEKVGETVDESGKAIDTAGKKMRKFGSDTKKGVKNLKDRKDEFKIGNLSPKKKKLTIILVLIGICICLMSSAIFIVVLFTPLIQLGIVRSDTSGSSSNSSLSNYSQTSSNISYWWPIGSSETRTENGVTYADGEPVGYSITSEFGIRNDPYAGNKASHSGLDIAPLSGDYGTVNVIAAKSGTVIRVNNDPTCESNSLNESCNGSGYGNYVEIEHQDGNTTLYGHMHKNTITVSVGDIVDQGQVIGKVGSSGRSTGMHLHFEVRENSIAVDPLNYISENNERPSATSNNVLMGSDSKQTICLTLKDNGYSDEAVAGLMGNMEAESGFRPNAVNELGCVGIVQWCFSLANELKTTYGDSWSNIDSQLDFLLHELNNDFPSVNSYLHGNHTAEEHAYYFCMNFERPGASHCNNGKRQNFAKNNYEYIKNNCQ